MTFAFVPKGNWRKSLWNELNSDKRKRLKLAITICLWIFHWRKWFRPSNSPVSTTKRISRYWWTQIPVFRRLIAHIVTFNYNKLLLLMHNVQTTYPFISIEVTVQLVRLAMTHLLVYSMWKSFWLRFSINHKYSHAATRQFKFQSPPIGIGFSCQLHVFVRWIYDFNSVQLPIARQKECVEERVREWAEGEIFIQFPSSPIYY